MLVAQEQQNVDRNNSEDRTDSSVLLTETPERIHGSLFDGVLQRLINEHGLIHNNFKTPTTDFDRTIFNSSNAVLEIVKSGKIVRVNSAVKDVFSFEPEDLINHDFFSIILPEYRGTFRNRIEKGMESIIYQKIISESMILFRGYSKLNRVIPLEAIFVPIYRGGTMVFLAVIRRLIQNNELMEELKESAINYDALSETLSEVIIRLDENLKILFANSAVKPIFGYRKDELVGKSFSILFPQSAFKHHRDEFLKYFLIDFKDRNKSGLKNTIETLGKNKNRGVSPIEISFGNSRGRSVTCIIRDIAQRKTTERKLKHLAFHDKLTGLGNRDLFTIDAEEFLQQKNELNIRSALFFLDLDGFKQINDTFGHDFGDKLLIYTAKRIRGSVRESDSIYRFGGDEFVILIQNLKTKNGSSLIAQNILNEIKRPYYLESLGISTVVSIGVSIGIAIIPDDGKTVSELVKNADLAMYSAKNNGKNRFVFFNSEMNTKAQEHWDIEQGLKNAITNKKIQLYYQPIVTPDGTVKGAEALSRWFHPEKGLILPSKFIPIAEESSLINTLGMWIMEQSCRDLYRLNNSGWENLFIAFNLSAKQFNQPDLAEHILKVIQRTGVEPKNIHIEITETSIVKTPEKVIKVINILKEQYSGIQFVLDDFGTGYSSLSYLSKMPIDCLKIDITFVQKLFDPVNMKVVKAILNLAESLNLNVIAEGVEGTRERDFFKDNKRTLLQGYLFSKAISFNDFISSLKSGTFPG